MKQLKHTILGIFFMVPAILTSCITILDDDNAVNGHETMEVEFTRSTTSALPGSGLLIFWKQNLGDLFTSEVNNLEDYKATKFNTGETYPNDNTMVYATGFSPMTMQHQDNFQTLSLPQGERAGTVDVCASSRISGKLTSPFSEMMSFEHTLTKVTFYAQRHITMVGSRNVENIRITIPAATTYLATNWKWNATDNKYKIDNTKWSDTDLTFEYAGLLFETEITKIGTAYLMLPTSNNGKLKNINFKADITPINSTTVENKIDKTLPEIQLYEKDNTQEVALAKPGEAYEVLLVFQQNSFTLIARQQNDWDKGGLIYVPVKP